MPEFFFRRYVNGERMADDVLITKQSTLEAAIPEALRLCRNSPKSVLVYVPEDNALREENARLREATKRLILSISASWSAFERGLREEIGNTNYVCVKEKIDAAAAAIREGGNDEN